MRWLFTILIISTVAISGCVSQTKEYGSYQLRQCGDFEIPETPTKTYIETGIVTVTASGITAAIEGTCWAACNQADSPDLTTQPNTPGRFEECRTSVCAGIRTDPFIAFRDQYEPEDPLNSPFLTDGRSPHTIEGTYGTTSTKEGRSIIGDDEFPVSVYLTKANLVFNDATELKGNFILFGFFDFEEPDRIAGNVSRIYNGSFDINKAHPLLRSELKVDKEGLCMDAKRGEFISIPVKIDEISKNADAVDFKMLLFKTSQGDVDVFISKPTIIQEAISIFSRPLGFFTVYSDREYDAVWSGSDKIFRVNIQSNETSEDPFSGVLYIRSDNSNTMVIPIFINLV